MNKNPTQLCASNNSSFGPYVRKGNQEKPEGRHDKQRCVYSLTHDFVATYKRCNPSFRVVEQLPQRILTNPSEGVLNNGLDNEDSNLICRVHDTFVSPSNRIFTVLDNLGTGTFGQVFRCQRSDSKEIVAVKVIKNKPAYHAQGMLEVKIARMLNDKYDPEDRRHIVRLIESFEYKGHICLVFELLSMSLLDVLTQNQYRGLPLAVVQRFTKQILTALVALEEANIIHCDLKPENILLVPATPSSASAGPTSTAPGSSSSSSSSSGGGGGNAASSTSSSVGDTTAVDETRNSNSSSNSDTTPAAAGLGAVGTTKESSSSVRTSSSGGGGGGGGGVSNIKVIDFGSACFEGRTVYSYIQSRFYRSPEVLLGVPYNGAIDMWSLACVCAEMYLGLPLFPGVSQHNQLARIVEMLDMPPDFLIEGKNGHKYFASATVADDRLTSSSNAATLTSPTTTSNPITGAGAGNVNTPAHVSSSTGGTNSTVASGHSSSKYRLKSAEEYAAENNTAVPVLRKYLRYSRLEDVIMRCPLPQKARMSSEQKHMETIRRRCFLDFLGGLFRLNPFDRWTAKQALTHPFIQNTMYTSPYTPPPDLKVNERKLNFMVLTSKKLPPTSSSASSSSASSMNHPRPAAATTAMRMPSHSNNAASNSGAAAALTKSADKSAASVTGRVPVALGEVGGSGEGAGLATVPLQKFQRRMTDPLLSHTGGSGSSSSSNDTNSSHIPAVGGSGVRTGMMKRGSPVHSKEGMEGGGPSFATSVESSPASATADTNTGTAANTAASATASESRIGKPRSASITSLSSSNTNSGNNPSKRQQQRQQKSINNNTNTSSQSYQQPSSIQQYMNALSQQHLEHQLYLQRQQQQMYDANNVNFMMQNMALQQQQQQQQQGYVLGHSPGDYFQQQQQSQQMAAAQIAAQMAASSSLASSYSSYGGGSGGAGMAGSVQDNRSGGIIMGDFGFALMRPETDEQRRLMSQQAGYWQQSPGGHVGGFINTMGGMQVGSMNNMGGMQVGSMNNMGSMAGSMNNMGSGGGGSVAASMMGMSPQQQQHISAYMYAANMGMQSQPPPPPGPPPPQSNNHNNSSSTGASSHHHQQQQQQQHLLRQHQQQQHAQMMSGGGMNHHMMMHTNDAAGIYPPPPHATTAGSYDSKTLTAMMMNPNNSYNNYNNNIRRRGSGSNNSNHNSRQKGPSNRSEQQGESRTNIQRRYSGNSSNTTVPFNANPPSSSGGPVEVVQTVANMRGGGVSTAHGSLRGKAEMESSASSYLEMHEGAAPSTTTTTSGTGAAVAPAEDGNNNSSSIPSSPSSSSKRPTTSNGNSNADVMADWDPFFDSDDP